MNWHGFESNFKRVRKLSRCTRLNASESLEPRRLLAGDPMIAEFQAINESTIRDSDGDFSDWIELRNRGDESVDLAGWYLTDDQTDLTKWRFPATPVASGEQIVVFASGKDRAESELHTNFKLSGDGEYLGLVQPDGVTVAQDFGSEYPTQFKDQSYGLAFGTSSATLLDGGAEHKTFVPRDDSLGTDWVAADFDDDAWVAGSGAIGFENLRPAFGTTESFDAPLSAAWTVDIPEGGNSTVELVDGALRIIVPEDQELTAADRGLAPLVYRDLPSGNPNDYEIVTDVVKMNAGDRGSLGLLVYDAATQKPALLLSQSVRRSFTLTNGTFTYGDASLRSQGSYSLRLRRDEAAKTWTASAKLEGEDLWVEIATIQDGLRGAPVISDPKIGVFASTPRGTINVDFLNFQINVDQQRPSYDAQIQTNVGAAMFGENASMYARIPFNVEGDASRFGSLTLGARYDDGFKAYLNGAEVTSQNVPVASAWNSNAAGVHGAINEVIPMQRIEFDPANILRDGENVLAIHGMNVAADDADFYLDMSMIASELMPLTERAFPVPSPGEPNLVPSAPAPEVIATEGVFFGSTTIELTLEQVAPTLEVRYTLDGNMPTRESALYTEPIVITESTMLQARTFDTLALPSFEPSSVATGTFIAIDEDLRATDSDLPIMIIDTIKQGIPGDNSNDLRRSNVVLFDVNDSTGRASIENGIVDYLGRGGARDRGSSTAGQPKPNMAFETWGPTGSDQEDDFNTRLLNLSAESDWVLHAPFNFDRAFMRNSLAYELSRQMDMWAPHTRFIEVYLNRGGDGVVTDRDYAGIYVLMEKIKQGERRVDIAQMDPMDSEEPEVSGGYIWKIDRADPDAPGFQAGRQMLQWVYPKSPLSANASQTQKATLEQEEWVKAYIEAMNTALDEPDINDPEGYSKYLDVNSWVDQNIINALMWNVDAFVLSAFLHKDRDGKIAYGPAWDFDRAAESLDVRDNNPEIWRNFFSANWWNDLRNDPGFWQLYADRWANYRQSVLNDDNVSQLIDGFADEVREASDRNFARWTETAPRESSAYLSGRLDGTFQGEVEHLRHWLFARLEFMDSVFVQPGEVTVNGQILDNSPGLSVLSGQEIELYTAPIDIFHDRVIMSGEPGAETGAFLVPIDDSLGDAWVATDFDDSSWTRGPLGYGFDSGDDFSEFVKTEIIPNSIHEDATTFLVRIPFEVTDLAAIQQQLLVLRMKYDDGFVAYLNGQEIQRDNLASPNPSWDSHGGINRPDRENEAFADFDISEHKDLLVEGTNLLAFRVINTSAGSNDMLLLAGLVSRNITIGRNPDATLYYTLDGSDPRMPDGSINPNAMAAKSDHRVTIMENTRLIARNVDEADRGPEASIVLTNWSSPLQYDFVVAPSPLQVSEIHYHPADPNETELNSIPDANGDGLPDWNAEDFEFVEIQNATAVPISLVGVEFSSGVEFDFTNSSKQILAPGELAVVANNQAAFRLRYGPTVGVVGEYSGSLDNNGERLELIDGTDQPIFSVSYIESDPWPARADGIGASLELIDSQIDAPLQNKFYSWRASHVLHGTPGSLDEGGPGVVINEVIANTAGDVVTSDSIELFNNSGDSIDLGGWFLSDSDTNLRKFQIPDGTTLDAGEYIVFDERDFNRANATNGFALNADQGDSVWLTRLDPETQTVFVDDVHFRSTLIGESLGRVPNATGRLAPLAETTFGAANGAARVGSVLVNELNYSPGSPSAAALAIDPSITADDLEFIEIFNSSTEIVELTNWRLRGGVDYTFAEETALSANDSLVAVKFNPGDPNNARRLAAFRAHYGLSDSTVLVGGYAGQLSNNGDRITLLRPISSPADRPNFIPRVVEDEVLYDDLQPWPVAADGTGHSLQRSSATTFGNDPASWLTGLPSPGSQFDSSIGDFDGNGSVDEIDVDLLLVQIRQGQHDETFDLTGDGLVNTKDRDAMVRGVLKTDFGDSNLDGVFNSNDLVIVFQAGEYDDAIVGNSTWAEGDWNGDGDFGSRDLVLAFQSGSFVPTAISSEIASRVDRDGMFRLETMNSIAARSSSLDRIITPFGDIGSGSLTECWSVLEFRINCVRTTKHDSRFRLNRIGLER